MPRAFLSFFFSFLSFFRSFYNLFYFSNFGPCSFTYQSEEATLTLFLTSYDIYQDQEDDGCIIQSSSLIHIFCSTCSLDLPLILVGAAGLVYLLKSFLFLSASLILFYFRGQPLQEYKSPNVIKCFRQDLIIIVHLFHYKHLTKSNLEFLNIIEMEKPKAVKSPFINTPPEIKLATEPTQQVPDSNKRLNKQNNVNCLSNILELSQQYDGQGKTIILQSIKKKKQSNAKNQMDNKVEKTETSQSSIFGCMSHVFQEGMNCIFYTYRNFYNKMASENVNIEESQISEMLSKLRKKKSRKVSLLPQLFINSGDQAKRTLVLDLQETLVMTTFKKPSKYDFQIKVEINNGQMYFYGIKRFGLDSFLFQMSQYYQIVVFSSSKMCYVQKIVEKIDPKKYISHILGRQHCIIINKTYYLKSVKDLGRDPKNVVMVDSHPISASLNPENLYKIELFKGSTKDRKLVKLGHFLKYLQQEKNIRQVTPIEMLRRQFESKQIHIREKYNSKQSPKRLSLKKRIQDYEELVPQNQTAIELTIKTDG